VSYNAGLQYIMLFVAFTLIIDFLFETFRVSIDCTFASVGFGLSLC
jgi:hypothetical protein